MNDIVIHRGQAPDGCLTQTIVGFRGYDQEPLLLVWREYIDESSKEVVWANILFSFDGKDEADEILEFVKDRLSEEILNPAFHGFPSLIPPVKALRQKTGWDLKKCKEYVDIQAKEYPIFRVYRS